MSEKLKIKVSLVDWMHFEDDAYLRGEAERLGIEVELSTALDSGVAQVWDGGALLGEQRRGR